MLPYFGIDVDPILSCIKEDGSFNRILVLGFEGLNGLKVIYVPTWLITFFTISPHRST